MSNLLSLQANLTTSELSHAVQTQVATLHNTLMVSKETMSREVFSILFGEGTFLEQDVDKIIAERIKNINYHVKSEVRTYIVGRYDYYHQMTSAHIRAFNEIDSFDEESIKKMYTLKNNNKEIVVDVLNKILGVAGLPKFKASLRILVSGRTISEDDVADFLSICHALGEDKELSEVVGNYTNASNLKPYISRFNPTNIEHDFDFGLYYKFVASSNNVNFKMSKELVNKLNEYIGK